MSRQGRNTDKKASMTKIIPCLDTKDGRLVKGVNFTNLKELGDPAESARHYSDSGADELVFLDITATLEGRQAFYDTIRRTVANINIPLTVGGGINSIDAIQKMFDLGVSKVSMNSAAVKNPDFVQKAVETFGSQRITVAIDTRKSAILPSGFEVVINGGTVGTGLDAVEWAKTVENLGVGAILPTSMDTDGKQTGYDIPMTRAIADAVKLPIIASGGAGALEHLYDVIENGHATDVLVASIVHFGTFTIPQIKEYLKSQGIQVSAR